MATRTEKVVLELEDNFTTGMARAAAAAALLRQELDGINGSRFGNFNRQTTTATTNVNNFGRSMDQNGAAIDRFSGRLGLAVDAVLALGPGLIPLGAVAGQAAAGLAALGAAAVIAGGSAIVAFQGIGDAVKAIQDYQDDPTADNLKAAREELDKMAPAARQFVMEFQKVRPLFSGIQDQAARGWFPGLTEALGYMDELAPKLEDIFFKTGQVGGALASNIAESLSGPRWDDFLAFLADEVPSAMASLTRTMGSLAHGAAEMWMAFDPGNDSFMAWVEGVASGFDRWASSADGRDDISAFLQYAEETGPDVAELFSSLVGALAALTRAAAPLGGPVLDGLTAFADVVKVIADSDMATPILAGLAALRLYARAAKIAEAAQVRLTAATRASAAAAPISAAASGLVPPHLTGVANQPRPGTPPATGAARYMPLLGSAAMIAGLAAIAIAASKAASANNELTDSLATAQSAVDQMDFGNMETSLLVADEKLGEFREKMDVGKWELPSLGDALGKFKNDVEDVFGDSDLEEGEKQFAAIKEQVETAQTAVAGLGEAMGLTIGPTDDSARSIAELEGALAAAKPAMDALGVSQQDLIVAQQQQQSISEGGLWGAIAEELTGTKTPFDDLTDSIREQADLMDSAQGRADNYRAVLQGLASDAGTAAEQADRFREAMAALVSPTLDAEEALSAQRDALKEISELNAEAGFTQASEVGRANLEATREYTSAVQERIATMINADRSEQDIAKALQTSRTQFIQSGVAAGFSAEQMRKRANVIGLTPKLIETTFRALGITKLEQDTRALRVQYEALPKDLRTRIRTDGIPQSIGEARKLANELDLTAKERRALMRLVTDGQGNMAAAKSLMDSFRDKSVTLAVNTVRTTTIRTFRSGAQPVDSADGGSVPKDSGGYFDKYLYRLAPGEEIISNRYGQADRFRADRASGRIPGYADGGTIPMSGLAGTSYSQFTPGLGGTGRTRDVFTPGLEGLAAAADAAGNSMQALSRLSDKQLRQRERALEKEIRLDEKARDQAEEKLDQEKQQLDELKSMYDQFAEQVSSNFRTDIFGGGIDLEQAAKDGLLGRDFMQQVQAFVVESGEFEGEWLSDNIGRYLESLSADQLTALQVQAQSGTLIRDTRDAREFEALLQQLTGLGLNGGAYNELAASGNLQQAQAYANMTPAQIAAFEQQYNIRNQALQSVGVEAGNAQFGQAIREQTREVKAQLRETKELRAEVKQSNKELRQLQRQMQRLEKAAGETGPDRTARGVTRAVLHSVSHGQRSAT